MEQDVAAELVIDFSSHAITAAGAGSRLDTGPWMIWRLEEIGCGDIIFTVGQKLEPIADRAERSPALMASVGGKS